MEDLISRQAVLDKIKEVCFSREQEWVDFRISQGSNGQRNLIINFIEDLPCVQPKPKTGHWIADVDRWGDIVTTVNGYRCDKCNTFNSDKDNYCPNCGCRMVEPQESEGEGCER